MSGPDTIEIVCGTDVAYAPHLGVLLRSMAVANRHRSIRVHILHDGVDAALQRQVAQCAPEFALQWYPVIDHRALRFDPLFHITRATYLRLTMAEQLAPAIGRVLFLDVDIVVNGDLWPLWTFDLAGKVCAAVVDPGVDAAAFAARFGLAPPARYFNAGVVLFDLARLRQRGDLAKAVDLLAAPDANYEFADQDALNIVLWHEWLPLDPAWNFQRCFLYDPVAWRSLAPAPCRLPQIIHFTQFEKPWLRSNWHPYAWFYLKHLLRTPFRRPVMAAENLTWFHVVKWWLRMFKRRPEIFRDKLI